MQEPDETSKETIRKLDLAQKDTDELIFNNEEFTLDEKIHLIVERICGIMADDNARRRQI